MAATKLSALAAASPALADYLEALDVDDTTMAAEGTNKKVLAGSLLGLAGTLPGGRLTTESGVGVSTSDRTSQSTLYYTPFASDYVRLYDGTRVREYSFTERSLALSSLTSGKNYDVWLYDNSGTLTLELLAWTNDTTRATALAWQSGLGWTKSGDATRLYLGTIRTTGTTTTEDSGGGTTSQVGGKRFVWNLYNRVARPLAVIDTTDSWTYSTASYRQANAASGNKVEIVNGLAGGTLRLIQSSLVGTTAVVGIRSGVGENTTTANSCQIWTGAVPPASGYGTSAGVFSRCPGIGYHYYAWVEKGGGSGTQTWYGDTSGDDASGIAGVWEC